MDTKDKQSKGSSATASKTAASKNQVGGEAPSPGQGATSSQNQGGTQNQGATGSQGAGITPQQNQGMVGAQHDQTSQQKQQNQGSQKGSQQNQGNGEQDLMEDAKQTASEVVNQVQERASDQFNRQKETAASELSTVVNAVRRFGETLNNEGNGPIARFAAQYGDKAANGLDRLARYLREQDPKRLLDDVQNFGRRQPVLLISGAFLLGFAGARVIKSSLESASSSSTNTAGQRWSNTGSRPAKNTGGDTGAGQQPFNTGLSGAQTSTSPNRI